MNGFTPGPAYERQLWRRAVNELVALRTTITIAMAHNLDDQAKIFVLQEKLDQAWTLVLEIGHAKGVDDPPLL